MSNTQAMREPLLLTPGPLTTSASVKQAMLRDFGSRDASFIALTHEVKERLTHLANGTDTHVCVPVQGSGTFAIEATLDTLLGADSKALVLINGAYGERMVKILDYQQRAHSELRWTEDQPVSAEQVHATLRADGALTHVLVVHCETTSGILNPVPEIAAICQALEISLIVDAMSSFGALDLDVCKLGIDAVVASSNKCLEGAPGLGFAIIREAVLATCAGQAQSLSLDLYDQWQGFARNNQWRFTPPTHVLAALHQALVEHEAEGGITGRGARYRHNMEILVAGMRKLGFRPLLPASLQAPIIITFHMPAQPAFDFQVFYDQLASLGFVIYPGKLTVANSFRIGCIGRLGEAEMRGALAAIGATLTEMNVNLNLGNKGKAA
jgi:2-aminoethylphosphonate-pyruvate transaminase